MRSIAFAVPWIGELPEYFSMWLKTCEFNPTIDFYVFTDDRRRFDYPDNVKVIYVGLEELKERFQSKFDFKIYLDRPYKFCDFKPAFGEVFSDHLKGYDFWGHCDIDLAWGDIRKFVTEDILEKYPRIYTRGHCILYRNNDEVNSWYRTLPPCGCQDWRRVFSSESSRCFDEWGEYLGGGLSLIVDRNNIEIYDKADMADINRRYGHLHINRHPELEKLHDVYLEFDRGKLYAVRKGERLKELMYAHFQKRPIELWDKPEDHFYISAPGYLTLSESAARKRYLIPEIKFTLNSFYTRGIAKIRRKLNG